MAAPLTDSVIARIRELIMEGGLSPGQRLPPEAELSSQLGVSRGSTREAVRALATAGVLDVRRGDGTFVTALTADTLLNGIGHAVELMGEGSILELLETRRLIEPQVTALAAGRATTEDRTALRGHLEMMRAAEEYEELVRHDAAFHAAVADASRNRTLAAVLTGISSVTVRARVWRGVVEADAAATTVAEHAAILVAIEEGDVRLAESTALVHVAGVERWMRSALGEQDDAGG